MPARYGSPGNAGGVYDPERGGYKARQIQRGEEPIGQLADPLLAEMTARLNTMEAQLRRVSLLDLAGVRQPRSATRDTTTLATADATAQERSGADFVLPGVNDDNLINEKLLLGDVRIIGSTVYRTLPIEIPADRSLTSAGHRRVNIQYDLRPSVFLGPYKGVCRLIGDNALVQGFAFPGGSPEDNMAAVEIVGNGCKVIDIQVSDFQIGLLSLNAALGTVLNCEIFDAGSGIELDSCVDWLIDGIQISVVPAGNGFQLAGLASSQIFNGHIEGGANSFGMVDCEQNQISNWELVDFSLRGVSLVADTITDQYNSFSNIIFNSPSATDENIRIFSGADYNKFWHMFHLTSAVGEVQDSTTTSIWADVHDHSEDRFGGVIDGSTVSHDTLSGVSENDHHNKVHTHGNTGEGGLVSHDVLSGVSADDHHALVHTHGNSGEGGLISHDVLTGVSEDDHHNKVHTHGSTAEGGDIDPAAVDLAQGEILTVGTTPTDFSPLPAPTIDGQVLTANTALNRKFAWASPTSGVTDHDLLSGVSPNDHHNQVHGLADHDAGSAKIGVGTDAAKGAAGTANRLYWATDTEILYYDTGAAWVETVRGESFTRLAQLSEKAHSSLSGVGVDDHHNRDHAIDGSQHSGTITTTQHGSLNTGTPHDALYIRKDFFNAAGELIGASAADTPVLIGGGNMPGQLLWHDRRYNYRMNWKGLPLIDDHFLGFEPSSAAPSRPLQVTAIGSPSAIAKTAAVANHPGILRLPTAASASTGRAVHVGADEILLGDRTEFSCLFKINSVAAAQVLRIGFFDSLGTGADVDALCFELSAANTIRGLASSNSSVTNTGTTYSSFAVDTWYLANMVLDGTAEFKLCSEGGTVLWSSTVSTNIPTGAGRTLTFGWRHYTTNATAKTLDVDRLILWMDLVGAAIMPYT